MNRLPSFFTCCVFNALSLNFELNACQFRVKQINVITKFLNSIGHSSWMRQFRLVQLFIKCFHLVHAINLSRCKHLTSWCLWKLLRVNACSSKVTWLLLHHWRSSKVAATHHEALTLMQLLRHHLLLHLSMMLVHVIWKTILRRHLSLRVLLHAIWNLLLIARWKGHHLIVVVRASEPAVNSRWLPLLKHVVLLLLLGEVLLLVVDVLLMNVSLRVVIISHLMTSSNHLLGASIWIWFSFSSIDLLPLRMHVSELLIVIEVEICLLDYTMRWHLLLHLLLRLLLLLLLRLNLLADKLSWVKRCMRWNRRLSTVW